MKMDTSQTSSSVQRRARTRSLIQLGGLLEHAGTLEAFNIPLGVDLQTNESIKNNIASLFKSLLIINEMIESGELDLNILALQGLEAFKSKGLSESRSLDRKKHHDLQAYSADELANSLDSELSNDNSQLLSSRSSSAHSMSDSADKMQDKSSREFLI